MSENTTTPRERIEKFMDMFQENVGMPTRSLMMRHNPTGEEMTLSFEDLHAVLSANAGYEKIIAEQRREAVAECKKTLAAELRERVGGVPSGDAAYDNGYDTALESIADDLEDGTL